jgi:hypothetical protein
MTKSKLIFILIVFLFANTIVFAKKKNEAVTPSELRYGNKMIIGEKEKVYFPTYKLLMDARIDTGATTTSIDARNIKPFEKDGKKWVKFEIVDRKTKKKVLVKKPVSKIVNIKRHGAEDQKRYAVKIKINMGKSSQYILVTLADRSKYEFPVLIGRNFLRGVAIVDVEKAYTVEPVKEGKQ